MGSYQQQPDVANYIRSLEQRIANLERTGQSRSVATARVSTGGTQTVVNNTPLDIANLSQLVWDGKPAMYDDSQHDRLTFAQVGVYLCSAHAQYASNGTVGFRRIDFRPIGAVTNFGAQQGVLYDPIGSSIDVNLTDYLICSEAGAGVGLTAFQSSGGNQTLNSATLSALWVGNPLL